MTKILIVEDDENIAGTIKATLTMVGYTTEICYNGAEAVEVILGGQWDLVLLDVMLPGLDGFGVMEKIRSTEIPVIFLTAMQNVLDKVNGLRLGAEDYIVKPFEALELLARIEVVLRRKNKLSSVIKYGDITVDTEGYTVKKGESTVALTPKEFQSLMLFLSNIDVAVTRERLLSTVWGYDFEGESRTVDIHIQQLRKKLGLHKHLVTIPKLGYRLNRYEEL
ncbi:MAG: response regulator transcription factor [Clostridia bacterium]|nr:response regulator transcription factor [Clostridia bacterium]